MGAVLGMTQPMNHSWFGARLGLALGYRDTLRRAGRNLLTLGNQFRSTSSTQQHISLSLNLEMAR